MTPLLDRLKLRHKLAALSVVGVAMCLLPLWQVMRYQSTEIERGRTAEYGPDAAVLAVAVQRALLNHRDAAGQVLRGQPALETERRELQVQVDLRLVELNHGVQLRGPQPAVQETQAMRSDWLQLAQRVLKRSLTAGASDAAHRLLVEQTLQVIDLVADTSSLMQDPDPAIARLAQALVRPMARLSVALLNATPGQALDDGPRSLAAAAADADRALMALAGQPGQPGLGGSAPTPAQAFAEAAAGTRKAVQDTLRLQRDAQATPAALDASRAQALQAHAAALSLLQVDLKQRLNARVAVLEEQRGMLGGAVLLLGLLAVLLVASVLRGVRNLEQSADAPLPLVDGQSPQREATRWLWLRARRAAAPAPGPTTPAQQAKHGEEKREP